MEKATYKAFTLMEIILVMVIVGMVSASGSFVLFNYYRTSIMDFELKSVRSRLQRVRQLAISNDSSSDYSVKFLADNYVIFEGSTYSASDPDNEIHGLTTNVLVSTTYANNVVTFNNFSGRTGAPGSITLSAFGLTRVITINQLGIVEDIS